MAFRLGDVVAMRKICLHYVLSTDEFHRLIKNTDAVFYFLLNQII